MRRIAFAIAATFGLIVGSDAGAAEITALVSTAMKAPFGEIVAQFEKATGHKVIATFGPTGPLTKRIADGETADVGSVEDVKRVVRGAARRFGTIDVLVNNASILGPRVTIAEYPDPAWEEVLRINLSGVFFLCREVLPLMLAKRSGSIINVTSGVGRKGKARWGAYAVSKAGLECLTQVLADEVKDSGIRVNAVNPAATRTVMRAHAYPQEDPLTLPEPKAIVGIFLYLASEASVAVSGQSLDARDWVGRDI